eukprot:tig00000963_g5815.t1
MAAEQAAREVFKEFTGDGRLADTGAFLVVPTYDIEERCPVYFSTAQALADPDAHNLLLRDVLRAAVAAPAILAPVRLHCPGIYAHKDYSTFVDGWAKDPHGVTGHWLGRRGFSPPLAAYWTAESLLGEDFIRLSPRLPPGLDNVANARPEQLRALCRTVEKQVLGNDIDHAQSRGN